MIKARVTTKELAGLAGKILIGKTIDVRSEWNEKQTYVYSYVTISTEKYLKGSGKQQVVIKVPGGVVGNIGQRVLDAPGFKVGERFLLFLRPGRPEVMLRPLGKFNIKDGINIENGVSLDDLIGDIQHGVDAGNNHHALSQDVIESSLAYCTTGFDWTYRADPMGEPYYINPNTFDVTDELDAVKNAADTWSSCGACFSFSYGGTTAKSETAFDGENVVFWGNNLSGGALAETTYWYDTLTGDCLECDMEFNDDFTWYTDGADYDVETVALHEFGHYLVLCHSDNPDATMYPYYNGLDRDLHQDDINGIRSIYGYCGWGEVSITDAYVVDTDGVRKTEFYPKEPVQFHIIYDVMGEPNTEYKVKGIIRAWGEIYYKTQLRYPGTGYHAGKMMQDGRKIKVRGSIPIGKTKTIVYKLKLKDEGELVDKDKAKSWITIVAPQ